MNFELLTGDCREEMKRLDDCSVDAVVTDPPYELTSNKRGGTGAASLNLNSPAGRSRVTTGFMGKRWDGTGAPFDVATWAECLRVLKPGGHLLAFGGSRTYHRLACAIEDAGFEIRDQIQWLYGSGFPKSLNIGNGRGTALKPAHEPIVVARKPLEGAVAANVAKWGTGCLNIDACRVGVRDGDGYGRNFSGDRGHEGTRSSDETRATSLRAGGGKRPLRVGDYKETQNTVYAGRMDGSLAGGSKAIGETDLGRWPANVIHDGSDEVLAAFPDAPGQQGDLSGHSKDRLSKGIFGDMKAARDALARLDSGSAARFFYCAKATQDDREEGCEHLEHKVADTTHKRPRTELDDPRRAGVTPRKNHHPTVKPTELMRYLCRLVTPPGGLVLDPFCGSGSTGKAALLEGLRFIGIELEPEYAELAQLRIGSVKQGLLEFSDAL